MADQDHLKILKKGVESWNHWRMENRDIRPNLTNVAFVGINLTDAKLNSVNFSQANLSEAKLARAQLDFANLSGANLAGAKLMGAQLRKANLRDANLRDAYLTHVDFSGASLVGTDFSSAWMSRTLLIDLDMSKVRGLEAVRHIGPSEISISTIYRSKGQISGLFLRGAGVPNDLADYALSLAKKIRRFYSCFISYSSKDTEFAERLHADLQSKGVRCWFAPEDLKIGEKLRPSFDLAIHSHDKLMVVLSRNAVGSVWVEKEVETAFEKEHRQNRTVLFPIRLDDAVMETSEAWAADIRRTRHIGDFHDWKDSASYKKAFARLLRDLQTEGNAESSAQE
jgi:hypothetical protein